MYSTLKHVFYTKHEFLQFMWLRVDLELRTETKGGNPKMETET